MQYSQGPTFIQYFFELIALNNIDRVMSQSIPNFISVTKFLVTAGWSYDGYQRTSEMIDLAIKSDSSCKNWAEFPKDVYSATGGVIKDIMPQYNTNRWTATLSNPLPVNAGARVTARNKYAAVTVIPIPNIKLVIAPIISKMMIESPAKFTSAYVIVPILPVKVSEPIMRPIATKIPASSANNLPTLSMK